MPAMSLGTCNRGVMHRCNSSRSSVTVRASLLEGRRAQPPKAQQEKRSVLESVGAAAAAICLSGLVAVAPIAAPLLDPPAAFAAQQAACPPEPAVSYSLPPLPFKASALEPFIDARTMEIHHDRHHQAYISNLNQALAKHPDVAASLCTIEDLNVHVGTKAIPEDITTAVRNNGGGHYNHSFFWKVLAPNDSAQHKVGPSQDLQAAIDKAFGSTDSMKEKFNAAAAGRFGSGWAWLGVTSDGSLAISSTPNQDNPLQAVAEQQMTPILGLDVWEHAYYLKYQNKRPDYIAAFWNVVNWEQVNQNYADVQAGKVTHVV